MLMAVDDADAMTQMVEAIERYKDQPRYIVFRNRGVRTSLLYEGSDVRKKAPGLEIARGADREIAHGAAQPDGHQRSHAHRRD